MLTEHRLQDLTRKLVGILHDNAQDLDIEPNAEIITGEAGVIGIETSDGETFFIQVKPA